MSIEEQIAQLIDKYKQEVNRNQSEADLRAGYVDLLFLALGWNVYNNPGELTNYRREGYIRGAGYADVGLEIAGQPVLLLEAKKFGALPSSGERTRANTSPAPLYLLPAYSNQVADLERNRWPVSPKSATY